MNERYRQELIGESVADRDRKDHTRFEYASDIIAKSCVVPFSIWVEPNATVRRIINSEIDYNSLPYDEQNEVEKGMSLKEQAELVAEHQGGTILCEALEEQLCLQGRCPLFVPVGAKKPIRNTHGQPLCEEFKITFIKKPGSQSTS